MAETADVARDKVRVFIVSREADAVISKHLAAAIRQIANVIDEEGARLASMDSPNALKE